MLYIRLKKIAIHAVEAAVKDLENFVPKNSQYLEDSQDYINPQCSKNIEFYPDLHEVPITTNLQTLQNTTKSAKGDDTSSEEGGYSVHSNQETPNSGRFTIRSSSSKDASKMEEVKASQSSLSLDEFMVELHAIRVTRDKEVEIMKKRLELKQKREERKIKREESKITKLRSMLLNTLLVKEHLSPEDEDIKRRLLAMLYGKR